MSIKEEKLAEKPKAKPDNAYTAFWILEAVGFILVAAAFISMI